MRKGSKVPFRPKPPFKNLLGLKFGSLTVISITEKRTKSRGVVWLCECDCGEKRLVATNRLTTKTTISCGCSKRKPPGVSQYHRLYLLYKGSAKRRNYSFNLTEEQLISISKQNCFYCGKSPENILKTQDPNKNPKWAELSKIIYNGIDRKDNTVGYEVDNCIPCCKRCNYAKGEMNISEFLEHIGKIYEKHFK